MKNLNIETSQHVQIDYEPAGIGPRVGAFVIDSFLIGLFLIFSIPFVFGGASGQRWVIILFFVLPAMSYHLLFELFFNGQSIGKKAVNIRVIKTDGTPGTLGSYLLRWIFRLFEITVTSGLIAFFSIIINGEGQRLGDMAAGTAVVKTKNNTGLNDTLYADIQEGYTPKYPQAAALDDSDISVVKEVLRDGYKYDRGTQRNILLKTRNAVCKKMGMEADDQNPKAFLETIVKDYNVVHG
ncbi:putative membrane protein YckC, RDD family [Fodinibius salinus]|uniref:Putative membrane protein YckC, RDD family n=1 Tax=Fodinibius salinus TaxID=860790 RepID=A0A5D3YGW0_9BACT|nr:RDD family protein [Fodinibius salinus]TYP92661.1 putative membrane protein YckC, RDD family [Fodinibius salinus]